MPSQTQWDSDNDEGDVVFDGQDTVATLPLDRPRSAAPAASAPYTTQPTQPVHTPPHAPHGDESSPPPTVQVAASSPRLLQSPIGNSTSASLGHSMAPPGTNFRNPAAQGHSQPKQTQHEWSTQLDAMSDSEDELMKNSNIKPTSFARGASSGSVHAKTAPPPQSSAVAASFLAKYLHQEAPKRPADAMADSYANARRTKQARTESSASRATSSPGIKSLSDITDHTMKSKATRVQNILPNVSPQEIVNALQRCRGNEAEAMVYLADQSERKKNTVDLTGPDSPGVQTTQPSGHVPSKRNISATKSIAEKHSKLGANRVSTESAFANYLLNRGTEPQRQTAVAKPPPPPPAKQTVPKGPSIGQKYSTNAATATSQPTPDQETLVDGDDTSPAKPKRRLQAKGRGTDSPASIHSPSAGQSPAVLPQTKPKLTKKTVESDAGSEEEPEAEDSGVESDIPQATLARNGALDTRILSYINDASLMDLVDLSSFTKAQVEVIVSKRPYNSLEDVQAVTIESLSTTSKGNTRTSRNHVGVKLCEILEETFEGYDAVDALVTQCEDLGRPISNDMKQWGFDVFGASQTGELQLVDLAAANDSGIGTPSSSSLDPDGEDEGVKSKRRTKFLQQPSIMSDTLVMKDYQLAGLNWLALLFSKKLSCILADDMGLGKTCQVIAFLAHLKEARLSDGPHLIIVPGSTLENWIREIHKFCPQLSVEPYYGKQQEREDQQARISDNIEDINVIITTYDMASKSGDAKFLRRLRPVVCVYDEGHALKNSQSQRYKELMRIPAEFRLLLTGTPLQNNLQELISLLAFIMPKVFEEKKELLATIFRHKAKTTDSEHTALLSQDRISRARSMMTPFILRRKKHQVLKHLPKKHTRVEYCDLLPDQRALYDERTAAARQVIEQQNAEQPQRKQTKARGKHSETKLTQNVLMDMRKAALHPMLFRRLYKDDTLAKLAKGYKKTHPECSLDVLVEDFSVMTDFELNRFCAASEQAGNAAIANQVLADEPWLLAGKVQKLVELVTKFHKNGDRTLVFSQFTMVLDILELVFESARIGFYRLDGSTQMQARQDLLDAFYADDTPVFMLSTKAGGAGINLACANKVIIFDMSFNPQDDVQAENRAHRVGQTREVEVIRLVSRGTIEESILRLGESKLALDQQVAGEAEGTKSSDTAAEKKAEKLLIAEMLQGGGGPVAAESVDAKDAFTNGLKKAGLTLVE